MINENGIQTVQSVNTSRGTVVAVCRNEKPGLPKPVVDEVTLILAELKQEGIEISSGMLGDNMTVAGLSVMSIPLGTRLEVGEALLEVTEVRVPCSQLNGMNKGLLKASVTKEEGEKRFRAGIMARVLKGGRVRAGDEVIQGNPQLR